MKIVIVDALTFGDADLSSFFKLGDVDLYQTTSAAELLERVANANVIVKKDLQERNRYLFVIND